MYRDDSYSFDKHIEQLKLLYAHERECSDSLRRRINEYNKDDEIKKRDDLIKDIRKRSLLIMTENESSANDRFIKRHFEAHKNKSCSTFVYALTGNGIGTSIKITCPVCNETEDITDIDSW